MGGAGGTFSGGIEDAAGNAEIADGGAGAAAGVDAGVAVASLNAGADGVLTYFALDVARKLKG